MGETLKLDLTLLKPQTNHISESWWEGIKQQELRYQSCRNCKKNWLPAIHCCPYCASENWMWEVSSGKGELYSWAVIHRAFNPAYMNEIPYTIVAVTLNEGPRVLGRYFPSEHIELKPNMKLKAKFFQKEGQWLLGFEPDV